MKNSMMALASLRAWFKQYVKQFLSGDEHFRHNIELKLEHTGRVCSEIIDLAGSQGLADEEVAFSESSALLHDVGRFEQYRRYRTFSDRKSEDHARLGVRILEEHRVVDQLAPKERDLLYRCIRYHNRLRIPEGETERCLFYSRLLRDADKLDIWRVVTDYYNTPDQSRNPVLELDMPRSPDLHSALLGRNFS